MKMLALTILLAVLIMLSACAAPHKTHAEDRDTSPPTAEAEFNAEPSRAAVFIYGRRSSEPKQLTLNLAGEPVLLPSGYVRLAGVVSGPVPIACLEAGGRGIALREGETLDDYRVVGINGDQVVLEKR